VHATINLLGQDFKIQGHGRLAEVRFGDSIPDPTRHTIGDGKVGEVLHMAGMHLADALVLLLLLLLQPIFCLFMNSYVAGRSSLSI